MPKIKKSQNRIKKNSPENICEISENCAESGAEETSITATKAIQKFETQSKVVSDSSDDAVSSPLLQETVCSRLKKENRN